MARVGLPWCWLSHSCAFAIHKPGQPTVVTDKAGILLHIFFLLPFLTIFFFVFENFFFYNFLHRNFLIREKNFIQPKMCPCRVDRS